MVWVDKISQAPLLLIMLTINFCMNSENVWKCFKKGGIPPFGGTLLCLKIKLFFHKAIFAVCRKIQEKAFDKHKGAAEIL